MGLIPSRALAIKSLIVFEQYVKRLHEYARSAEAPGLIGYPPDLVQPTIDVHNEMILVSHSKTNQQVKEASAQICRDVLKRHLKRWRS